MASPKKTSAEYEILDRLVDAFEEDGPHDVTTKKDELRLLAQAVKALEGEYAVLRATIQKELKTLSKSRLVEVQKILDLYEDDDIEMTTDAFLRALDSMTPSYAQSVGENADGKRYEKLRIALAPLFLVKRQDIYLPTWWRRLSKKVPNVTKHVKEYGPHLVQFLLYCILAAAKFGYLSAPALAAFATDIYFKCSALSPDWSAEGVAADLIMKTAFGSSNSCYLALQTFCVWVSSYDTRLMRNPIKIVVSSMQDICGQLGFWDSLATFKKQRQERKDLVEDLVTEVNKMNHLTDKEKEEVISALRWKAEYGLDSKNSGHRRLQGSDVKDKQSLVDYALPPNHPARKGLMEKHNIDVRRSWGWGWGSEDALIRSAEEPGPEYTQPQSAEPAFTQQPGPEHARPILSRTELAEELRSLVKQRDLPKFDIARVLEHLGDTGPWGPNSKDRRHDDYVAMIKYALPPITYNPRQYSATNLRNQNLLIKKYRDLKDGAMVHDRTWQNFGMTANPYRVTSWVDDAYLLDRGVDPWGGKGTTPNRDRKKSSYSPMPPRRNSKKELLDKLQECMCEAEVDYKALHQKVTRKMKTLAPAVHKKLWKLLQPTAEERSPSLLTTALFEYVQSMCAAAVARSGRRMDGERHEALRTLLGFSMISCLPPKARPATVKKVATIAPKIMEEIEDYGTNLMRQFMATVLESAHVYPSTIAKMLASFSSLCLEDVSNTSLCLMSAKFICMTMGDVDDTKLNLVQFVVTRQLKLLCSNILGSDFNHTTRQKKSPKHVLVDLIHTSKELTMKEKDQLVANLGGIDILTEMNYKSEDYYSSNY